MTALDMNKKALAIRQAIEAQRIWDSLEDEGKSQCMEALTDYYNQIKDEDEEKKETEKRYATDTLQKYN